MQLHSVTLHLLELDRVHAANANLHQGLGEPVLHNSRKGTGVRIAVSFKFGVEIGVCIEMNDGKLGKVSMAGLDQGEGDGVVATEKNYRSAPLQQLVGPGFDRGQVLAGGAAELQVASVEEIFRCAEVDAHLAIEIAGLAEQCLTDLGRSLGGAAQVRRVGVEGNAENGYRHGVIIRAGLSASTEFLSPYLSVNDCLGYARVGSICESREGLAAASLVVGEISRLGTVRRESLDFMIPLNERHLRRVLRPWVAH